MSAPAVATSTPDNIITPTSMDKATNMSSPSPAKFDPCKHLAYTTPPHKVTMSDIALPPTALSPIASTSPFPLLTYDAILHHRREIFSPSTLANCLHTNPSQPSAAYIRGMAPRHAPLIHSFWHSPELLKIISDNAGVDLVPAMDYEICHTNVQLGPAGVDGVAAIPVEPPAATDDAIAQFAEGKADAATDESKNIVHWHKDSHPFVCVVMLSDARNMLGGETELRCGDGRTVKVRAPQMVRLVAPLSAM